MYQPVNQVRLRGFLAGAARLFVSRSGQPQIAFRMEVRIDDDNLPPKRPAGVDYFSVAAFGTQVVGLLPQLEMEHEVTFVGRLCGRDIDTDGGHIVTEVMVHEIVPLRMRGCFVRKGKTLAKCCKLDHLVIRFAIWSFQVRCLRFVEVPTTLSHRLEG